MACLSPMDIGRPSMSIDLEEQNKQLEIERAVLLTKLECFGDKLELINDMRTDHMNTFKDLIEGICR